MHSPSKFKIHPPWVLRDFPWVEYPRSVIIFQINHHHYSKNLVELICLITIVFFFNKATYLVDSHICFKATFLLKENIIKKFRAHFKVSLFYYAINNLQATLLTVKEVSEKLPKDIRKNVSSLFLSESIVFIFTFSVLIDLKSTKIILKSAEEYYSKNLEDFNLEFVDYFKLVQ